MSSYAVAMTNLGNLAVVGPAAIASGLWLAWRGGRGTAWRFLKPVGVMFALTVGLKLLFRLLGGGFAGTPFALSAGAPSGHVEMTAAVYGGVALVLLRRCRAPICLLAAAPAAIILVGVAVTRVSLHAHTPADVAVGLVIGSICALWVAHGVAMPPDASRRYVTELLALLVVVVVLMQLSGLRVDSARFI
jgi:membrane-associated phospholipid phosphatase